MEPKAPASVHAAHTHARVGVHGLILVLAAPQSIELPHSIDDCGQRTVLVRASGVHASERCVRRGRSQRIGTRRLGTRVGVS